METILFHPETSKRRALILALGTYGPEGLSTGEREPLIARLADVYRNDPDAGIHGAAEWVLRRWGYQAKLEAIDLELPRLEDRSGRRWFVNGQRQTFAVIDGPVEFLMGSINKTENVPGIEVPRRMAIPRKFAVASKEVTASQFQRFLKAASITDPRYTHNVEYFKQFSPDPEGPWIALEWYVAAHYCNWLSGQDDVPRDQWCYIPAEGDAYAEGMTIPADVLERTGYRLPTEAEWEYACRAGAVTSRYYGRSTLLLGSYARYQANSQGHAWMCGSLLPNDLGLFDMLGNEFEWIQEIDDMARPSQKSIENDVITVSSVVHDKDNRLLRGGTYDIGPTYVRSAVRTSDTSSAYSQYVGLRPFRTCR
jgi:hypothetical protein